LTDKHITANEGKSQGTLEIREHQRLKFEDGITLLIIKLPLKRAGA
jgi:hypothetical protein